MIVTAEKSGTLLMTAYRPHCDPGTVDLLERVRGRCRAAFHGRRCR